jgi:mycothiol system anti-sigma-R factor
MSDPCEEALHELYHFLDGELTDVRRDLIKTHLDECLTCLGAYDFEADLRRVVAERCRDSVPESLRVRIALAIGHDVSAPSPEPRPGPGPTGA